MRSMHHKQNVHDLALWCNSRNRGELCHIGILRGIAEHFPRQYFWHALVNPLWRLLTTLLRAGSAAYYTVVVRKGSATLHRYLFIIVLSFMLCLAALVNGNSTSEHLFKPRGIVWYGIGTDCTVGTHVCQVHCQNKTYFVLKKIEGTSYYNLWRTSHTHRLLFDKSFSMWMFCCKRTHRFDVKI